MKVKCIELNEDFLTKGKIYEATKGVMFGIDIYWVVADDGCEKTFPRSYFEIVKEDEEMKKLTFREVIDRKIDKEYEIWEGEFVVVTIFQNNRISVVNKVDGITILEDDLFRLKGQEYSFQEAFEAYEKGKIIQSCVSGKEFNKKSNGEYLLFGMEEVRGKWYINK